MPPYPASNASSNSSNRTTMSEHAMLLNRPGTSRSADSAMSRLIQANKPQQQSKFASNIVSTTKYNAFTFLPLFFFESFRRYSNAFFLFIACLQQIPDVSPTGRWTTLVPLSFILFVSACKEIFEDIKRRIADGTVNNRKVLVYKNGFFTEVRWRDIRVGDIVKVLNKEEIPADLILLTSSEPQGLCYIETANLDGETNLKTRSPLLETVNLQAEEDLTGLEAMVECEQPNRHLYEFTGNIQINGGPSIPLGPDQLLLRGSRLKNSEWVYGVAVYTGHDSKLMQNSKKGAILMLKRSQLDELANQQILIMFGVLLLVCIVSGVGNTIWRKHHAPRDWYLKPFLDDQHFGFSFLTFFILYNNLIPISLQVSLEMVRFLQTLFIGWDLEMYDEESDTPTIARTSNLNEDLGQIKYVFSDKTGTLTQNKMIFRQCSIGGLVYGVAVTKMDQYVDTNLMTNLVKEKEGRDIHQFLLALALCHTVVPEVNPADPNQPFYLASSPDEAALVQAAAALNYVFLKRHPNNVTIRFKNRKTGQFEHTDYELLDVLDFDSDRKRMSVIVKMPDGKIVLICKGADTVIQERLGPQQGFLDVTLAHLEEFAHKGLRTLCIASADLSSDAYAKWKARHNEAATAMEDRKQKVAEVNSLIEQNLSLLGATAIEDRLQVGVPNCIAKLLEAGIKVWVLTGDKMETAINIGHSCNLINMDMPLFTMKQGTLPGVVEAVQRHLHELGPDNIGKENNVGLVVDGKALYHALGVECRKNFLDLAISCKAVICCRVSPMQKADVITLVRSNNPRDITLAIGDGANDVAMIQTAHVGVGISGKEGLQAVCASDYAISQFRFLQKLLLVHGAWSYERIAKLVLYCYHKNICLYIMQFYFAIASSFSGQTMFERWTIGLYNLAFTAAPPFILGLFDKSCSAASRMKYPKLYEPSQRGELFNPRVFWKWIGASIYHAAIVFMLCYGMFYRETIWADGLNSGGFVFGAAAYTYVIVVVCMKAGLETSSWTMVSHIGIWGSALSWFFYIPIYSNLYPHFLNFGEDFVGVDRALYGSWMFWFGLVFVPVVTLLLDVCCKAVYNTWHPSLVDQVRQIERKNDAREFQWEPISGLLKPKPRMESVMNLEAHNMSEIPQRGYAFSQDENGPVTQAAIALRENTDTRYAERMARRSRESLAASAHGSPVSLSGRGGRVRSSAFKIKHL